MPLPTDVCHRTPSGRRPSDFLLFGVTLVELALLVRLTPTFGIADWIYVLQNFLVLGIALTRRTPATTDRSISSCAAVIMAYAYPYAQVLLLRWKPGEPAWSAAGLVLVTVAASLSLASLLSLGNRFGVRPALRGLTTRGAYQFVRHPMYLAYMLADIGYNLVEWNAGTAILVLIGWWSLLYRIRAEERVICQDAGWSAYASSVRHRLLPGLW